jgi:predicted anti-sigma-YlaC factor YlaD
MKCKQIHDKLLDYADGLLSDEETRQASDHLAGCSECSSLYGKIKEAWQLAKAEKIPHQPFFYTRVRQGLENRRDPESAGFKPLIRLALQPAMLFVVLALGIFIGIQLGKGIEHPRSLGLQNQPEDYIEAYAENQYLNGLKLEPLEEGYFMRDTSAMENSTMKPENHE